MIIVTGGAGFIGSCVVRSLNDRGREDIIIVDNIAETDKWRNISNKKYIKYYNRSEFLSHLHEYDGKVTHVFHLGACSATTEKNFDYLYGNNFEYTKALWSFCARNNASFIYASSAATYGDGALGFDDRAPIGDYLPLNGYGYSKQLFDLWEEKEEKAGNPMPPQHVGLKFFNVYGPNEYFKGSMASVIFHGFNQVREKGWIGLFKSYKEGYGDGGQLRDFVYVKDVCAVMMFLMDNPQVSGLFNVGTGKARSFYDLGCSVFRALGLEADIRFIEMPESLRPKYQYYTQATMEKLRGAGYDKPFHSLEDGAMDYVQNYLNQDYRVW
jgi:ADP-L-glycero-D-manno-heptose 6-epimerase